MNRSKSSCNTLYRSLTLLLLVFLPATGHAATLITPFEVDYDISSGNMIIVHMKRRLSLSDNGEYRFESNSRPSKAISWLLKDRISEYSLWQFHQQQPRPVHYHYQRRGGKKLKHIELEFNWQQNRVSDAQRSPPWSSKIPPLTSDKLLYQLQLMLDLQAGKENLSYTIVDSGKIRDYVFKRIGTEIIQVPLGRYETIKLQRITAKRTTTIWCAPELDFLPIRIEHRKKNSRRTVVNAIRVKGLPFKKPLGKKN